MSHVQLIDFAQYFRKLNATKVLAAKPTLIGTVLGVRFYEHPTRGDEVGTVAIDLNGNAWQTDFYDLPHDDELIKRWS